MNFFVVFVSLSTVYSLPSGFLFLFLAFLWHFFIDTILTFQLDGFFRHFPLITAIIMQNNISEATTWIILQNIINPKINIRLSHFLLTNRTTPISTLFMCLNQSLQTNTNKMPAISTTNWYLYPILSIRTN